MLFNLFTKLYPLSFSGQIDIHNHLLYGVDDGSKSLDESKRMLKVYKELGFESIILTPHIFEDIYPNSEKVLKSKFQNLIKETLGIKSPKITNLGAEYMVDDLFLEKVKSRSELLPFYKNYVLIEIPLFADSYLLKQTIFELQLNDYIVVLAHPERYLNVGTKELKSLREKGVMLQLNALSLTGNYGKEVRSKAFKLLKNNLFDFIATDAHNPQDLEKLKKLRLTRFYRDKFQAILKNQKEELEL